MAADLRHPGSVLIVQEKDPPFALLILTLIWQRQRQGTCGLWTLIPLWLEAQEIDRLVTRLRQVEEGELEALSHFITEPAAARLATSHPDVAARLYRALGLQILPAKKSKYYGAALVHFAHAKECYARAGLDHNWQALVALVSRLHGRKYGFMPGFERMVRGQPPQKEPSFLEQAQRRWWRAKPS